MTQPAPEYVDRTDVKVFLLRKGRRRRVELDVEDFGDATIAVDTGLPAEAFGSAHDQPVVQIEIDHPFLDGPAAVALSVEEASKFARVLDRAIRHARTRGGLI